MSHGTNEGPRGIRRAGGAACTVLAALVTCFGCRPHLGSLQDDDDLATHMRTNRNAHELAASLVRRLEALDETGALRPSRMAWCARYDRPACADLHKELALVERAYHHLEAQGQAGPVGLVQRWLAQRLGRPPACRPDEEGEILAAAMIHRHGFSMARYTVAGSGCVHAPTLRGWVGATPPNVRGQISWGVSVDDGTVRASAMGNWDGCGWPDGGYTMAGAAGIWWVVGRD